MQIKQLKGRNLTKATQMKIYKTLIRRMISCTAGTMTMTIQNTRERVQNANESIIWREENGIVLQINSARLQWLGGSCNEEEEWRYKVMEWREREADLDSD